VKFLVDEQGPRSFTVNLRGIGWDITAHHEEKLPPKMPDWQVLAYARSQNRILITFDDLKAQEGVLVARELRERGGQLIKISRGPEQPVNRAIGKLLFHEEEWTLFFARGDGVVEISDLKNSPRMYQPAEYLQRADRNGYQQFEQYISRARREHQRGRKPQEPHRDQARMDLRFPDC
jgi:hypothetical protein